MPVLLKTVEEIIATQFKREGYWMVFNRAYNEAHAFKQKVDHHRYLKEEETDEVARAEFVAFMQEHFPDVKTYPVFDVVSLHCVVWPYLGSIAIDMKEGDAVYQAISDKYDNPYLDSSRSNAVFWAMKYEHAVKRHEERVALGDWD